MLILVLIFLGGSIAGFINVIAGGGSMITLPLLIFSGLEESLANGTNRIAILAQNIAAFKGFKDKGFKIPKYVLPISLAAIFGAIAGSSLAVNIRGDLFNKILALLLVAFIGYSLFQPDLKKETAREIQYKNLPKNLFLFLLVGFYGGFIQAGVGLIIMAVLALVNKLHIHEINFFKVIIVASYTIFALLNFVLNDQVSWKHGVILALGNATGGWLAGRYSSAIEPKIVKRIVLLITVILAFKLFLI